LKIIPDVIKYIKFDADFRHVRRYRRSEVAFRVYGGYAYRYGGANREENATLPFFKQFFSGGPNNMRGWNLRSLGLGRDTTSYNSPNHLGDIQLEGNAEYRFKIGNVLKGTLNGGLFCDIGNIWSRYEIDPTKPSESAFKLSRLWQDLAISPGFGLRYDFNSIIIRIDCGFKLKDPARGREANSDGWMSGFTWEEQAFPSDPGRAAITRSNYAIQFAVGLPF
jgi:outer membrane protein insertion porin family